MNPAVTGLSASLIRELNHRKRPGDIDLGLGEPQDIPHAEPFRRAAEHVAQFGCPYTPNAGLPELRRLVAQVYGGPLTSSETCVMVTHGSQQALHLAVKTVLCPGVDEVVIVEPAYGAYAKLCQLEGLSARGVTLDEGAGFEASADRILAALRPTTRMVMLATPCNPTGRVWPPAELRRLARGLEAAPGGPVWLLLDEAYRDLNWVDSPWGSDYAYTLVVGSLSKGFGLTGLRLGWLIAPSEVITQAIKVQQQVMTATSTFSQRVGLEVLAQPAIYSIPRGVWLLRRSAAERSLRQAGLEFAPLDGAFYAFVRCPGRWATNSLETALTLLAQNRVVTIPGVAFGPSGEGWLRLSWAGDVSAIEEGIGRVGEALAG